MKKIRFRLSGCVDESWVLAERGDCAGSGDLGYHWPWKTYRQILREAKQRALTRLLLNEQRVRDERAEGIGV
jgi:hypothetical protein